MYAILAEKKQKPLAKKCVFFSCKKRTKRTLKKICMVFLQGKNQKNFNKKFVWFSFMERAKRMLTKKFTNLC